LVCPTNFQLTGTACTLTSQNRFNDCSQFCGMLRSGVARILKLGGTGDVARRADAGWDFGGGAVQRAPSPSARRFGTSCHYPNPPKNLLGFARILWPCLSTVGGVPPSLCPPTCGYATDAAVRLIGHSEQPACAHHTRFGEGRVGGREAAPAVSSTPRA